MKPIIAPTDFSPVSLNAVNYAVDMACAMNTNVVLMHVCRLPLAYSEVPAITEEVITKMINEAEDRLAKLKEDISARIKDRIRIDTEITTGTVVTEIEDISKIQSPYAVVMGARGTSTLERLLFGSNTVSAMKNLSCPLIVIPPEAKFTNIRRIGLACDLKRVVETAPIEEIKELVQHFNAQLHVVHVNREDEKTNTTETIEESGLLQEMLDELHPVYHFLNNVNIDEGLSEYAEKNNIDLLIVIPKKHGLIDKLMHKSHAKQLILHTHVPVMSVHE